MTSTYSVNPGAPDGSYLGFWRERHLCTPATPRPDGTPHVVPVGVTHDPGARLARVATNRTSAQAAHVPAADPDGAPVAVCRADGRRRTRCAWSSRPH
jgi:hypothetical protein